MEQARLLSKLRKFLGALLQFSQELGQPEVSERVRALVLSLASSNISLEEFRLALQEAINLPLRPYVMPLLKNSVALMQREILALARATNQSAMQYVTSNEQAVMELTPHGVGSAEFADIFVQLEAPVPAAANGNGGALFKRRSSDSIMEHSAHNGLQEWAEYMPNAGAAYAPPSKRLALHPAAAHSVLAFDYSAATAAGEAAAAAGFMQRDERELRLAESGQGGSRHALPQVARGGNAPAAAAAAPAPAPAPGGEEEWKNIHTMLNCISAMVDKTKRAITILQQRGIEPQHGSNSSQDLTPAAMAELRRQTEEKVAEFKRNAEDAVTQVSPPQSPRLNLALTLLSSRPGRSSGRRSSRYSGLWSQLRRVLPRS